MGNIKIRADGSSEIGLGHLVRTKALADMLKADFSVQFFCNQIPEPIRDEFEKTGTPVSLIRNEDEYFNSLSNSDIAIIDGYSFDIVYQKKVKSRGALLVCIDDLAKGEFVADLIINQSPGVQVSDYSAHPDTEFALGPDYALLRTSFLQNDIQFPDSNHRKNLLICFGGSDVQNITEKAVKLAIDFKEFDKITIITGSAYNDERSLKKTLQDCEICEFYHAVGEQKMAELMISADVAIVPASGILFEALATRNVVISGMYVNNQEKNYEAFKGMNVFIDARQFSEGDIRAAFGEIKSFKPRNVVDGKSPERLLSLVRRMHQKNN